MGIPGSARKKVSQSPPPPPPPTTSSTKRDSNENWETGKHASLQLKVPFDVIIEELPSGHGSTNPNPATQPGLNRHNAPDDASTGLAPAEAGPGSLVLDLVLRS